MKKFLNYSLLIILTITSLCCNEANEPQPVSSATALTDIHNAGMENLVSMTDPHPIKDRMPTAYDFKWEFAQTVVLKYNKSLTLKSPFAQADYPAGDVSWRTDGGCYDALYPTNVGFANLGIVDIKSVSIDNLKAATLNNYSISSAPAGSAFWPNYLPIGTIVACKTKDGRYVLLEVKYVATNHSIELSIYNGVYTLK